MDKLIKKLESSLFATTIFLIPTNLSLKLSEETAYIHGILVDYLIPKLYFTDLPILILLFIWLLQIRPKPGQTKTFLLRHKLLLLLAASLYASTLFSANPMASTWFLLKLLEMSLFAAWMTRHPHVLTYLPKTLSVTLVFQSLVGLVQWGQRHSILGYLFLGETTLKTTSNIAKTALTGELRPLPYGTTPHPNVLAGFLAVGLLILLTTRLKHHLKGLTKHLTRLGHALTYIIIVTSLLLTQSASAVAALLFNLLLLPGKKFLISAKGTLAIIIALTLISLTALTFVEPQSLTRRHQLTLIGLDMLVAHPLLGVGPNNYTAVLPDFGEITSTTTRFFQPIHNIYLLWIVETGLLGLTTTTLLIWHHKRRLWNTLTRRQSLPLLALLIIGLVDHYPLTLQTGQLLLALTLGLAVTPQPKPH